MSDLNEALFVAVDDFVRRAVKPLHDRIEAQAQTIARLEAAGSAFAPAGDVATLRALVETQAKTIDELESRTGVPGANGSPGKDAPPVDLDAVVAKVRALIPVPKDGVNGISFVDAAVDGEGNLLLTLSDGTTKRAGKVRGTDGRPGEKGDMGAQGPSGAPGESIKGGAGKDGASVDIAEVRVLVADAVKAIPVPKDGKDGESIDLDHVRAMIADVMLPLPRDGLNGQDGIDGKDAAPVDVAGVVAEVVAKIPKPQDGRDGIDGKDAPPVDVAKLVDEVVKRVPVPANGINGKDGAAGVVGKDGRDGIDGRNGADGLNGKDGASVVDIARAHGYSGSDLDWLASLRGKDGTSGRDGVSVLSAIVDGEGELVLTASDGARHKAGVVRGKDGTDGTDGTRGEAGVAGRDAVAIRPIAMIEEERSYPAGTFAHHAGGAWYAERATEALGTRRAQDCGWQPIAIGEQSFSIDVADDGRTVVAKRKTSTGITLERRFKVPVVIDRGIYTASKEYERGDAVTRSGSYFVARVDKPSGMPGASDDWRMLIKGAKL